METPENGRMTNDYSEVIGSLTLLSKIAYGLGHVLNDICASMWFTYLLVFFHYVMNFDSVLCGLILLIGQIADALATPFVGLHCDKDDNFWLCRNSKRKTWHLFGTVCVVLSFPFIFSPCLGCKYSHQWAQLVYYAAFVTIFQFGWASVQISHLSLIPCLTPKEEERTQLTAIRYSFTVFSNVLVYCVTWAVLHITSEDTYAQIGPNDAYKFREIVLVGFATGISATFAFYFCVEEGNDGVPAGDSSRRPLRSAGTISKDVQLYHLACVYMPTRLFVNLSQVYIPMYLHETLHTAATSLAVVPLVMYVSSFKASLVIRYINDKLGRRVAYLLGASAGICSCIWIWHGEGQFFAKYEIFPVALLLGAAGSFMLVTSLGLTADYIGRHTESGAFVYGAMSFADKLFNGLAVMLIQYLRQSSGSPYYYRDILVYVCGGSAMFGLLMILTMRPFIRDDGYNALQQERTSESQPNDQPTCST